MWLPTLGCSSTMWKGKHDLTKYYIQRAITTSPTITFFDFGGALFVFTLVIVGLEAHVVDNLAQSGVDMNHVGQLRHCDVAVH